MSHQIIISEKEKCLVVTDKKSMAITECLDVVEEIGQILYEMHWNRIVSDTKTDGTFNEKSYNQTTTKSQISRKP